VRLCLRDRWIVVLGANLGGRGRILFCTSVAVHVVLFNDCKHPVWIFVLMTFNVDEDRFHWGAPLSHSADCEV